MTIKYEQSKLNFDEENLDISNINEELTPVEFVNGIYFKREDKFKIFDVCGAKSRQAYYIIKNSNYDTICTCGSRLSPQIQIVANICKHLNKKCVCFTNRGKLTEELKSAISDGAEIIQNDKWIYNNVVIYHTKEYCTKNNVFYVPFGMESLEAIKQTAFQVKNIPNNVKNIVIVAGSGLNLCGVLWGLKIYNKKCKVKAIQVGKDINEILKKYAPMDLSNLEIIKSELDYHTSYDNNNFCGIELDKIYEAKCIPYIKKGDLFWIIGKRR